MICQLLDVCANDVTAQIVQDALYERLSSLGVKSKQNAHGVKNSGGMRTYFAQLACLGLFWKDPKTKQFELTNAGEEMIAGNDPLRILRCQLLRMQYPSAYGLGPNVRMSPSMKVKPFAFLVKLFRDSRLGGLLSIKDISVAVIYGRTEADYERCVQKILSLRKTGDLKSVIDNLDDIRTPKRYHEHDPNLDWERGLDDVQTIANTATNYMEAALLIEHTDDPSTYMLVEDSALWLEMEPWLQEKVEKLDRGYETAWQQRYGRYNKTRGQRTSQPRQQNNGAKALICTNYIQMVQESSFDFDRGTFIETQAANFGLSEQEVGTYINHLIPRTPSMVRDRLLQAAVSGGEDAIVLEKGITSVFRKLGFDLSEHIGQKVAKRDGGYPDIRVRRSNTAICGFVDTKASSRYTLPLADTLKLQTYYKDAWKEFPDKTPSQFFVYVAGGFKGRVDTIRALLGDSSTKYGAPVSAVTVSALLDAVELSQQMPQYQPEILANTFSKSDYYTDASLLLLSSK